VTGRTTAPPSFDGLSVFTFESRRARELESLITTFGGNARNAPALREVPLAPNPEALAFGAQLIAREVDLLVLLTGVGVRVLVNQLQEQHPLDQIVSALRDTRILARGPKPLGVLRELGVPAWIAAADPNTWRELIAALDTRAAERPLEGARVAVQEYGVSNVELLDALRTRGAVVRTIPAYEWTMPEDLEPLRDSARRVADGQADVLLFLSGIQLVHFWRVVVAEGLETGVRRGMAQAVVASIGPSCSSEIRRHDITVDLEASPPRMGVLVRAAAEQAQRLIRGKRPLSPPGRS
jgi:uroporphyrinogen-III synthase